MMASNGLPAANSFVSAVPNALQGRQIELDQFQAAARLSAQRRGPMQWPTRLREASDRPDHVAP